MARRPVRGRSKRDRPGPGRPTPRKPRPSEPSPSGGERASGGERPSRGPRQSGGVRGGGGAGPSLDRVPSTTGPREPLSQQALLERYRPDLARILADTGAPAFRYTQVLEHLARRPGAPFADASALPGDLRSALERAGNLVLEVVARREGPDGTTKLLLSAADSAMVETVSMPYGSRLTVCVSSQVGCAVGCAFCATGGMGFQRNLSVAEIVDQLRAAVSQAGPDQRLTNVVYMGMGEPLLNLTAVLDSIRVLTAPSGLRLGHRALSISTVGIPSGILRLARTEPQVNLALSLHAPDDATRALLIPDQFRHPIVEILDAAWQHFAISGRKLLVEYVLIAGVNDSVDDARHLASLLRGHVVTVNLLVWNPVGSEEGVTSGGTRPGTGWRAGAAWAAKARGGRPGLGPRAFLPPAGAAVAAFRAALRAAHIEAVVRQSKGAGIEAACGQLAGSARSYHGK